MNKAAEKAKAKLTEIGDPANRGRYSAFSGLCPVCNKNKARNQYQSCKRCADLLHKAHGDEPEAK